MNVLERHPLATRVRAGLVCVLLLMMGCGAEEMNDPVLARAYGNELHWSDLRQIVPVSSSAVDSSALAQRYITNWIKEHILLNRAEQNLGDEQKDFEAQLKEYRKDRLIYAYEEALISQKLDTAVSESQIEEYWKTNNSDFQLKESILRVRWSNVHESDRRAVDRLKKAFMSKDNDQLRTYEMWLAERGIPIVDRSNEWITMDELASQVAISSNKLPDMIRKEGKVVLQEKGDAYFLDILELRTKDSVSPLDMVRQDIRSMMINKRKLRFIEQMREDLYQQALDQKDVEIL